MKTFLPSVDELDRKWYVVDAQEHVLGRLASQVATVLMGKDKPIYTDFLDTGDFVVVVNADKVKLTGTKLDDKFYYSHSGYPGGLKEINARRLMEKKPGAVFQFAVRGMLPKNKLRKPLMQKLKLYVGTEHPHEAQSPETLEV